MGSIPKYCPFFCPGIRSKNFYTRRDMSIQGNGLALTHKWINILLTYRLDGATTQYHYMIIALATLAMILFFVCEKFTVRHALVLCILFTVLNFTLGLLLNDSITNPESDFMQLSDQAISYPFGPLVIVQIIFGFIAYFFLLIACSLMHSSRR